MAIAKAYGSITIVDIGDLGTLSVCPESNQPDSVIYDPNVNNGTYNPDWATTNLKLTPVIYYGGTNIAATDTNIAIEWKRKKIDDTKPEGFDLIDIVSTDGESMNNSKQLIVNKNILNNNKKSITYVCIATYTEPQTNLELQARGEISFSLISQPTTIKSCSIIGESVFLYNGDKSLKGAEEITLTANLSNCDISCWQYKTSTGWETITGQLSKELKISAKTNTSYFINDVATIRLLTNIDGVYDLHTITNIYDGASGANTFSVILSNEDMYVPCDRKGNILTGDDNTVLTGGLENAITEIKIYNSNDNVTNDQNTSISVATSGVTGEWVTQKTNDGSTSNKPTYRVTGMSALTGTVTFTATYTIDDKTKTADKTFYLTKLLAGNDGTSPEIYSIEPSTVVLNKTDKTNIYTPSSFTINAYKTVGSTKTDYAGRFKIYANGDTTDVYSSANDETSYTFTPSSSTAYSSFKVELYESGGFNTRRDSQTITVVSDGAKGDDGAGGLSFVLGNQSDLIPCTTDGKVLSNYTLTIPFSAYQGTYRVACKVKNYTTLPDGMSLTSTKATTSADGTITITVTGGKNLGGDTSAYDTGVITFTLETEGLKDVYGNNISQTANKAYTWTKNRQAASGADAVLLRAYAPNGNIINNGENDVTLSCVLTEGAATVTPTSYKWYVFKTTDTTSGYVEITVSNTDGYTGYATNTLTVPATAVISYASYYVEVGYKGKTYKDYISVQDKTDPLQVEIFSTLGDKITNSVGVGCIYARVFQDGVELDELQNLKVSTTAPASPLEGDVWAYIDESQSKIVLKKREGSNWVAFNLTNAQCSYNWTFGDYDGITTKLNNQDSSEDKFLYIQGSYITKKMQFNLEVTKQ